MTSLEKEVLKKKLTRLFLKELAERFSNDGCNDFRLDKLVPNKEDRIELMNLVESDYPEWGPADPEHIVFNNLSLLAWILNTER